MRIFLFIVFFIKIEFLYSQCIDKKDIKLLLNKLEKSTTVIDTVVLSNIIKSYKKCYNDYDIEYIKSIQVLSKIFQKDEKYNKSNLLLFEILNTRLVNQNLLIKVKIINELAFNYYKLNEYEKSLRFYNNIIEIGKNSTQCLGIISSTLARQANIFNRQGDFDVSIKKTLLGEYYGIKAKDNFAVANNLRERAKSLTSMGKLSQSLIDINKAILILSNEKLSDDLASAISAKAYIETALGKYEGALEDFKKSAAIFKKLSNYDKYGLACLDIGFLYYYPFVNYKKAVYYYNEGLKMSKSPFNKIQLYDNIGAVYWKQNEFIKALEYYQLALSTNDFFRYTNRNYLELPNHKLLKLTDFKRIFLIILQDKAICWLDYAKSENNKKEYLKNALKTYELADKLVDYMRQEHTGTQSKYFWRDKTRSIYESAIETCYLLKDYQKAFYFFEKSRSVLLNDKLNELGAKQKLSETDLQKEKDYLRQISELNVSIEKTSTAKEKSDLTNKLLDLQEQQGHFIKSLETRNPAYYRMKYDTTTVSLKQFQNYLTSFKGQAVEYFIGDSATYAIVISPNSASIIKLRYNVANTQQFLDFCSKNINTKTELSQYLSLSSNIYKSLIQPLNLQNGRLIISQDGVFMPFEAFSKSETKKEYLVHDFKISYTYSAQFLLRNLQNATFLPQNKFLGIAPVNYNLPNLSSLKGSAESLNSIAKSYFWSSKYVGEGGSKKTFLTRAKKYQIVQIYTHAFADSNETEPRIYFADTTLKVSELNSEEQFKTNLLVLSACKTGVGKVAKGEGVLSLARGFSMLGIPSTITSLWSVEDMNTYKLTELFYQYLNQGFPKDEALQKAKIDLLNEGLLPNSWAGMILIGDSSNISSDYWYVWLLAGLILITIAAIWYWRKRNAV